MKFLKELKARIIFLIHDRRAEYKFRVKDHEVTATFTDEPNKEIVSQIKDILLGDSHIRQTDTLDIKIKKKPKERER